MNLGEFLFCTTFFLAPVMGLAVMMMRRLLQDFQAKVTTMLNARRRLVFSQMPSSHSNDYSKETYFMKNRLDKTMRDSLVAYFSLMVHSFGTINAVKAIIFSRDGPMRYARSVKTCYVYAHDSHSP